MVTPTGWPDVGTTRTFIPVPVPVPEITGSVISRRPRLPFIGYLLLTSFTFITLGGPAPDASAITLSRSSAACRFHWQVLICWYTTTATVGHTNSGEKEGWAGNQFSVCYASHGYKNSRYCCTTALPSRNRRHFKYTGRSGELSKKKINITKERSRAQSNTINSTFFQSPLHTAVSYQVDYSIMNNFCLYTHRHYILSNIHRKKKNNRPPTRRPFISPLRKASW